MSGEHLVSASDAAMPSQAVAKPGIHLKYIEGFRGLAALYVVLGHALLQTWPSLDDPPTGWARPLTGWMDHGILAVTFFIAISGFCLMLPVLRNEGTLGPGGAKQFFFRRARRILPPYYVALVLSIVLVARLISYPSHSLYDESLPMTWAGVVSHLFLIHNLHTSTVANINGPLWSIAVECQIYLFFPLLVAVRRNYGVVAVLGGTYIGAVALQSVLQGTPYNGLTPLYLFVFALGMFAAEVAFGPKRKHFIWIGLASAILMIVLLHIPGWGTSVYIDVATGSTSMCLLIVCAQWTRNPIARFARWTPVAFVGTFSYSLYLIHFPIQQVIWQYLVRPMHLGRVATFSIMATAGTGIIVTLSYGFYWLFERPFLRHKHETKIEVAPSAV